MQNQVHPPPPLDLSFKARAHRRRSTGSSPLACAYGLGPLDGPTSGSTSVGGGREKRRGVGNDRQERRGDGTSSAVGNDSLKGTMGLAADMSAVPRAAGNISRKDLGHSPVATGVTAGSAFAGSDAGVLHSKRAGGSSVGVLSTGALGLRQGEAEAVRARAEGGGAEERGRLSGRHEQGTVRSDLRKRRNRLRQPPSERQGRMPWISFQRAAAGAGDGEMRRRSSPDRHDRERFLAAGLTFTGQSAGALAGGSMAAKAAATRTAAAAAVVEATSAAATAAAEGAIALVAQGADARQLSSNRRTGNFEDEGAQGDLSGVTEAVLELPTVSATIPGRKVAASAEAKMAVTAVVAGAVTAVGTSTVSNTVDSRSGFDDRVAVEGERQEFMMAAAREISGFEQTAAEGEGMSVWPESRGKSTKEGTEIDDDANDVGESGLPGSGVSGRPEEGMVKDVAIDADDLTFVFSSPMHMPVPRNNQSQRRMATATRKVRTASVLLRRKCSARVAYLTY